MARLSKGEGEGEGDFVLEVKFTTREKKVDRG